ncbi:hypothetical protein VNG_1983H [Halobacterium salinarum NRC-1]|uniref:Spurious ORF n=1 Tax=Halobacterium salinarum (strain ATCC 700922 / JCM 11081 / NRC-1) TaxID=64091 RepID=Q9HNR5_HALSA|nr:hypothetical protein VNG_1983H [Halobacterium salinarum NRC-1]DAC78896.1 TPA_inf: spurious ORF [Halobacterium salinarum NRC-1]
MSRLKRTLPELPSDATRDSRARRRRSRAERDPGRRGAVLGARTHDRGGVRARRGRRHRPPPLRTARGRTGVDSAARDDAAPVPRTAVRDGGGQTRECPSRGPVSVGVTAEPPVRRRPVGRLLRRVLRGRARVDRAGAVRGRARADTASGRPPRRGETRPHRADVGCGRPVCDRVGANRPAEPRHRLQHCRRLRRRLVALQDALGPRAGDRGHGAVLPPEVRLRVPRVRGRPVAVDLRPRGRRDTRPALDPGRTAARDRPERPRRRPRVGGPRRPLVRRPLRHLVDRIPRDCRGSRLRVAARHAVGGRDSAPRGAAGRRPHRGRRGLAGARQRGVPGLRRRAGRLRLAARRAAMGRPGRGHQFGLGRRRPARLDDPGPRPRAPVRDVSRRRRTRGRRRRPPQRARRPGGARQCRPSKSALPLAVTGRPRGRSLAGTRARTTGASRAARPASSRRRSRPADTSGSPRTARAEAVGVVRRPVPNPMHVSHPRPTTHA